MKSPLIISMELLFCICSSEQHPSRIILASDNLKTLQMGVNEYFEVHLSECIGCCGSWQATSSDTSIVRQAGIDKLVYPKGYQCCGGNGTRKIGFRAEMVGQSELSLLYACSAGELYDSLRFTIQVSNN